MVKGRSKATEAVAEEKKSGDQEVRGAERKSELGGVRGLVVMDRRRQPDRRSGQDRRSRQEPVLVERRQLQRRAKTPRRRQIDPTTCERDYTPEEIEFMRALDEYKRSSGRMFPTCSEILEVLKKLGYEKRSSIPQGEASEPITASPGAEANPGQTPPSPLSEKKED